MGFCNSKGNNLRMYIILYRGSNFHGTPVPLTKVTFRRHWLLYSIFLLFLENRKNPINQSDLGYESKRNCLRFTRDWRRVIFKAKIPWATFWLNLRKWIQTKILKDKLHFSLHFSWQKLVPTEMTVLQSFWSSQIVDLG